MTSSSISCIIPAYNGERHLAATIDSALGQTLPPMEIIVVDDGSTDGTAEIVAGYGERIIYVYQANTDTAGARNHGIRLARGQLIAFLDHDDIYHPQKLQRQAQRFDERPDLDMSLCAVQNFRDQPPPAGTPVKAIGSASATAGQATSWLVRRKLFDTVGLFDQDVKYNFAEGSQWYLRARQAGAVIESLPDVLVYRRLHEQNKTEQGRAKHLDSILMLCKRQADERKEQQ